MLDTNEEPITSISETEVRQYILQTLIAQEQTKVAQYLQKHKRMRKIVISFCEYADGNYDFNLGTQGKNKIAKYEFDNLNKEKITNKEIKQLITQYIDKLTTFDLITIHRSLEDSSWNNFSTYNKLRNMLTVWIITNFLDLYQHFDIKQLGLSNYSDKLITYLLAKHQNHWSSLSEKQLYKISQVLEEAPARKRTLNYVMLREICNALFCISNSSSYSYVFLADVALQSEITLILPISILDKLLSQVEVIQSRRLHPMILTTRNANDALEVIASLLGFSHKDTNTDNIQLLKDYGFKFDYGNYKEIYREWFIKLSSCPFYQKVNFVSDTIDALKIMFPDICK